MIPYLLAALLAASPLVEAVRQQDLAAVRALLQKRVDVNAPEGDGAMALHWAVYVDELPLVAMLLDAGASAKVANDLGITPLHLAAVNGNAGIVGRLLAKGADPNALSETGVSPLMEAARSGNADAVRALIAGGAHVGVQERDRGQTALMWAAARGFPQIVKLLVDAGADVHAVSRVRPLTVMLDQGPRRSVKTSRQDARQVAAGGSSALHFAAQNGDVESARVLIAAGADLDARAGDGNSPLVHAAFAGHGRVARVLLDAGADPNAADAGYTALHAAVLRGDLETVRALIARGADLNARLTKGSPVRRFGSQWALPTPMTGGTPLLVAATYLEVDILRVLVAAGADHALALPNGTTPLLAAAGIAVEKEARPSDLVRWNIVDSDTPQVPRAETDVLAATTVLLDAGADVNQTTESGDTAVHAAAAAGMPSVIQTLADRGAPLTLKNAAGQTPLDLTIPRGRQGGGGAAPNPGLKAAEELLKTLTSRE